MALSQEDIIRLARLAHFEIAPEDIERFRVQLNSVLEHMQVLAEVGTELDDEPSVRLRLRDDEVAPDTLQQPLGELTELTGGFFTVPRIIPVDEGPAR